MTSITFSISDALRDAWHIFKRHTWFFVGMTFVSIILGYAGNEDHTPVVVSILGVLAGIIWSIVWLKVSLAAARGDESTLTIAAINRLMPTLKEFLMVLGVAIVAVLLVACGAILLVIPGLYVLIKLSVSNLAYIDRKEGITKTLRYSWNITKGSFWTVTLVLLVVVVLYVIGASLLIVGLFVTYPLAMILMAKLYVALADRRVGEDPVVAESAEVPNDIPEAEVV